MNQNPLAVAIAKMSLQDGTIEVRQRTHGGAKVLYGHYYIPVANPDGTFRRLHKKISIGRSGNITKTEARQKLRDHIRAHFLELGATPSEKDRNAVKLLRDFVENEFYAVREGRWREESSAPVNKYLIGLFLQQFGARNIRTITKPELQKFIDGLHTQHSYSASVVKHVRTYTKAIFEEATEQGFIDRNPAARLGVPIGMPKPDHYFLPDWNTVAAVLAEVPETHRLMFCVAAQCAMRPAELVALRRQSFDGSKFNISETIYKGHLRAYGKTEERCNLPVRIPQGLRSDLTDWLAAHPGKPTDFLFATSCGTAQNPMNILHRVFRPIRKKLKLQRLNFQVLRRTWATLHADGEKDIDGVKSQLGHTDESDTAERVYIQEKPERQQQMLDAGEQKLRQAQSAIDLKRQGT